MHKMATKKTIIVIIITFIVVLTVEIIGMYYTHNILQQQDEKSLGLKMNFITKDVVRQIKSKINQIQYTISRPTVFFREIGKNVSRSVYHDIFQMDKNPLATSVETIIWLPKIYYYERKWYEDYMNFTISKYNMSDKQLYPVEQKDFYFPYAYSEPSIQVLDNISGFDFYSNPITKIFIDSALSTTNLTGFFKTQLINKFNDPCSLCTKEGGYCIILNELAFVDKHIISTDNIVGIVLSIINIGDIITISIENLDLKVDRNDIDVIVFDITDNNVGINKTLNVSLLYKENKPEYKNIWVYEDVPKYDYLFVTNIYINDRSWIISLRFLDNFVKKYINYTYIYIVISISLALFFFDICMCVLAYQKYQEIEKREIANKMLGYVNHEVRNPLNVITGMIDITIGTLNSKLQKENDPTIIQKDEMKSIISDLCTAGSSCSMLRHIVNDILDIRKLESNKLEINNDYIGLEIFCKNITKTITPKILEKIDLKFLIKIDDELIYNLIFVDKIRLEQILLNLIFNSIKFTVNGSITLSIKKKDKYIVFEVVDTGRGIPDETKKLIFQPFQQTCKEDSSRYGGIGLGLYLCKMLATCMEGTIGFTSQYGKGSVFYIEIPLKTKELLGDDNKEENSCGQSLNAEFYDQTVDRTNDHMINIINDSYNIPESKLLLMDLKKYNKQ